MAQVVAALQQLPGGAVLAKDETVQHQGEFLVSNVLPYLKPKLAITNKRLTGERPNTLLGIIPVGSEKVSYPLSNVAGVNTTTRISPLPLLLGILFVIGGLAAGVQSGWFALVLGVLLLLGSYQ